MKFTKLNIFFSIGLIFFLVLTAYFSYEIDSNKIYANDKPKQDHKKVIKFNHEFHLTEAGAECKDCHQKAPKSVKSSDNLLPKMEYCGSCHDIEDDKNCGWCHYEDVYKELEPTSPEVTFSHKYHLEVKKKNCTDCHKGLDKVKYAGDSPNGFPDMEDCYGCHNNTNANNNCEVCHADLYSLKPDDHLSSNFLNEHKIVFNPLTGKNNDNCMMCHTDNFCQVCHTPVKYSGKNTKNNFYAPYYTKVSGTRTDRTALQNLTTVHDMNYLYTHGLDAGHKGFECKTCHDPVEFCASCHQDGGNTVTGIAPYSHRKGNFTTFGVNSGGGLHAELARKDIESCQNCHDVEGADPVCIKCHFDNDGIKGTNPRTHEFGFLSDEKGIWHDTPGAICYHCHTDPNAKPDGKRGIGFCGYCHSGDDDNYLR